MLGTTASTSLLHDVTPMILAAGQATRLRPLTDRRAKAVVPFLNRPLLDYTLDWLRRHRFEAVTINLHHAARSIVDTYGEVAFGLAIRYSEEPVLLGTAGGPRAALEHLGQRVLLINGDVVTMISPGALARHHREAGAMATLALHLGPATAGYPQCLAATDGRLLGFPGDSPREQAAVHGVFTGLHVVERAVLEAVPGDTVAGMVDPVYRQLMAAGLPVHAVGLPGIWYEVGDANLYIDSQLKALERGDLPLALEGARLHVGGGYCSTHTHLESVRLVPPFLLGAGVRVKHGGYLGGVVAGDRSRFEAGSRLREVVTWPDAWIGPGCDLRRVIVMSSVRIPGGTVAESVVFTPDGPVPLPPLRGRSAVAAEQAGG